MKAILVLFSVIAIVVAYPQHFAKRSIAELAEIAAGNPNGNPEENSGQFEGDIILNTEQKLALEGGSTSRTGLINIRYRWATKRVPYVFAPGTFTAAEQTAIRNGLNEIQSKTCIRFVQRTNEVDYVYVTGDNSGCWSSVGRQGGRQQLNLQKNGCFRHGTIMHEFLHALGFYHMQSATDRDSFVTIQLQNVIPAARSNFNKYGAQVITNFGIRYDYRSVMHYGRTAFSVNGANTITTRDPTFQNIIGQRTGLSQSDVDRVRRMYTC